MKPDSTDELADARPEPADLVRERDEAVRERDEAVRERDEVVRERDEARAELTRSREHLTLFAGQVSHDLRTPLTAVLANAEMLAGEPAVAESEDLSWMVDGVTRAAERLNTMIERMLDHARQGGEPALTVTSLDRVFAAAVADLEPRISAEAAEVVLHPLPTLPGDADLLHAVALNLISNAIAFAVPGERPHVAVDAVRDGDRWRVRVTDRGVGIPPERREAMFVLFARGDKRGDGAGIGLAAVRRIVEAHGGRVGIDSAEGGGTTVWFELPA